MNLQTIYALNYGDEGGVLNQDDEIKVSLKNGEILIGTYESSDFSSLELNSEDFGISIDFKDIEDIKIVEELN